MSDTPDIKSLAVQALAGLLDSVKSTKDFTMEHAPDVLRQMVTYHAIVSVIAVAIGIVIVVVSLEFFRRVTPRVPIDACTMNGEIVRVLPWMFAIGGATMVAANFSTAIMATFAPKWFILTKLAELLK